jgi:hypothetical protein
MLTFSLLRAAVVVKMAAGVLAVIENLQVSLWRWELLSL